MDIIRLVKLYRKARATLPVYFESWGHAAKALMTVVNEASGKRLYDVSQSLAIHDERALFHLLPGPLRDEDFALSGAGFRDCKGSRLTDISWLAFWPKDIARAAKTQRAILVEMIENSVVNDSTFAFSVIRERTYYAVDPFNVPGEYQAFEHDYCTGAFIMFERDRISVRVDNYFSEGEAARLAAIARET